MIARLKKLWHRARNDRGTALVTVMLLVSVMAAGAAITFDALGLSVKRTTALRMFSQARLYALGGEQLALAAAEKMHKADVRLTEPQAVSYAIEGGHIEGLISDASNCFNVNSMVQMSDRGTYQIQPIYADQYARLLAHLGFADREAQTLTSALVDWIDSDTRPLPGGAEDYDYSNLAEPYRAANTLITDLSELVLIQGYTDEIAALVKPHLCADNQASMTVLNVNTLKVSDAPLLAAIIGGDFAVAAAADLIATRPARGYKDIADFYFERAFEGMTIEQGTRSQTDIKPQRFTSQIRVRFHDGISRLLSDIRMDANGKARLVRHQFGVFQ